MKKWGEKKLNNVNPMTQVENILKFDIKNLKNITTKKYNLQLLIKSSWDGALM